MVGRGNLWDMEHRTNTGGEQRVSPCPIVALLGNGKGGIVHARRHMVSHAISGMGTIDGNFWYFGGCGGRGSQKVVGLGTLTRTGTRVIVDAVLVVMMAIVGEYGTFLLLGW